MKLCPSSWVKMRANNYETDSTVMPSRALYMQGGGNSAAPDIDVQATYRIPAYPERVSARDLLMGSTHASLAAFYKVPQQIY